MNLVQPLVLRDSLAPVDPREDSFKQTGIGRQHPIDLAGSGVKFRVPLSNHAGQDEIVKRSPVRFQLHMDRLDQIVSSRYRSLSTFASDIENCLDVLREPGIIEKRAVPRRKELALVALGLAPVRFLTSQTLGALVRGDVNTFDPKMFATMSEPRHPVAPFPSYRPA